MNIKDYLHLYLGCECDFQGKTGIMYEVNSAGCRLSKVFGGGHIGFGLCKPILRKLSDIKDEEKIQWNDEIYPEYKGYSVSHKLTMYNINLMDQKFRPDFFRWLLSKHIDIFGLIENGLAIDKNSLK